MVLKKNTCVSRGFAIVSEFIRVRAESREQRQVEVAALIIGSNGGGSEYTHGCYIFYNGKTI